MKRILLGISLLISISTFANYSSEMHLEEGKIPTHKYLANQNGNLYTMMFSGDGEMCERFQNEFVESELIDKQKVIVKNSPCAPVKDYDENYYIGEVVFIH